MKNLKIIAYPGAFASGKRGAPGSHIERNVSSVIGNLTDDQLKRVHFYNYKNKDMDPTTRGGVRYIQENANKNNTLLLIGKSLGGAKILKRLVKKRYRYLEQYSRVGIITVDFYGLGYGYRWWRKEEFKMPRTIKYSDTEFIFKNYYQRCGRGIQGGIVGNRYFAHNILLDKMPAMHPYGSIVNHSNIIEHPDINYGIESMVVSLLS